MKLIVSNGVKLTVREVGPVIYQLQSGDGRPTPPGVNLIMEDDEARAFIQQLRDQGFKGEAT